MKYDIIGDIHGQADKLEKLLLKMEYTEQGMGYQAPAGHQAVFVGDLIDRGPKQLRVLEIVRDMVESKNAFAVLGNHEFNAIGYATPSRKEAGEFLRPRSPKNTKQHAEFLKQIGDGSDLHAEYLAWFKTLPLHLELSGIRVAHAWWDQTSVDIVKERYWDHSTKKMCEEFLHESYDTTSPLSSARKILTCGIEWDLPNGAYIEDKSGHKHYEARLAVWRDGATHLHEIALVPSGYSDKVPQIPVPEQYKLAPVQGPPIFIGHHWFSGEPSIESAKVACLDWSAATTGPLVAYRWNGEHELVNDNFVAAGLE